MTYRCPVPSTPADGEFATFKTWVNKARSWIGGTGAVCFDAERRRCCIGADFMRADREGAFPVRYWFPTTTPQHPGHTPERRG